MNGLFQILEAIDHALLVGGLYELVSSGAWKYFLRPTFLIPAILILWAYIHADTQLERHVIPELAERYKRSSTLHGLFGQFREVRPEGRKYWFLRLALALSVIPLAMLTLSRP